MNDVDPFIASVKFAYFLRRSQTTL